MRPATHTRKQQVFEIAGAAFLALCLHGLFMYFSGKHFDSFNPYNSYTKQCLAWLQGRLDLGQDYSWLELAVYQGKYFVSFPPFPSYVLLPITMIFGEHTPDTLLALLFMTLGVAYGVKLAWHFCLPSCWRIFLPVFLYCGTAVWQITVDGWVWFIAQNMSMALTLMSLYYACTGHKGKATFFLVCAVGCRPLQAVYLPLVLFLLYRGMPEGNRQKKWKALLFTGFWRYLPAAVVALSYLALNLLRFHHPFEFGHNYLPEFTQANDGQFSLVYIAENFPNLFRLPTVDTETGVWHFPFFNGMNIFMCFPIVLWHLFLLADTQMRKYKRHSGPGGGQIGANLLIILLIALHILFLLMHKTMGGAHFGNRYIADTMAAVFLGTCLLMQNSKQMGQEMEACCGEEKWISLRWVLFQALFLCGLAINMYGVLLFYKQL